jgi:hypothetical protein
MIEIIFYASFSGMVFRFIKPRIPRTIRRCLREPELSTEQSGQQGADHQRALCAFFYIRVNFLNRNNQNASHYTA